MGDNGNSANSLVPSSDLLDDLDVSFFGPVPTLFLVLPSTLVPLLDAQFGGRHGRPSLGYWWLAAAVRAGLGIRVDERWRRGLGY
jgi:hypothetical protein